MLILEVYPPLLIMEVVVLAVIVVVLDVFAAIRWFCEFDFRPSRLVASKLLLANNRT